MDQGSAQLDSDCACLKHGEKAAEGANRPVLSDTATLAV